jgi:peptidoglycan/xylan/chitin deacetylase (PgdA/CDA1 family)
MIAGSLAAATVNAAAHAQASTRDQALIAITLDLEMSRQFPTRDQMHWDYEKGNLDEATKRYAVKAAKIAKEMGGLIHFFALGRTMEQEDVSWLKEIAAMGHPVGNHTYDHVNVLATKAIDLQFRFARSPWLIEGKSPQMVISENIAMTGKALKQRAGITQAGFRTPGGFHNGLADRPDVQRLLLDQNFRWVSSKYPAHPTSKPGEAPSEDVLQGIVKAQVLAQPHIYPSGLIEIPMSPISDVGAFRTGLWKLDAFLEATKRSVAWCIDKKAVYDFLAHPSCLVVSDPEFRTIRLICDLVNKSQGQAKIVDLDTIARDAQKNHR